MPLGYPLDFPKTPPVTLGGFTAWVYSAMGVPQAALPENSPWIEYAYAVACATVNLQLSAVPGPIYLLAVYNLGGDRLVNWAQDQPGVLYPADNPKGLGYWAYLRQQYGVNTFVAGVINSSSDEGTSESLTVPAVFESLLPGQLQNLDTPWGRAYLGFAASINSAWGIS